MSTTLQSPTVALGEAVRGGFGGLVHLISSQRSPVLSHNIPVCWR